MIHIVRDMNGGKSILEFSLTFAKSYLLAIQSKLSGKVVLLLPPFVSISTQFNEIYLWERRQDVKPH